MDFLQINEAIVEVTAKGLVIGSIENGIDLIGNAYYQGFDCILMYEENITPLFFDLSTKMAGEILQKFSNYKMRLAIIGSFSAYQSKSFKDFVYESNLLGQINFVNSRSEAIAVLSKK